MTIELSESIAHMLLARIEMCHYEGYTQPADFAEERWPLDAIEKDLVIELEKNFPGILEHYPDTKASLT